MSPTGVLLVRHGQSEWNAVRRWQGTADIGLTPLGRAQAEALGRMLADGPHDGGAGGFSAIWSSDLSRASETARIIADHLGIAVVRTDARLREAHAGSWQGLTPDEIERGWPGFLAGHRRPDDFEHADSVVGRALDVCRELLAGAARTGVEGGRDVIAVTHSGLIRSLCRHVGDLDERVPNLGGIWVHLDGAGGLRLGRRLHPVDAAVDAITGLDGPGEDPGDESDDGHRERGAEGRPAR